jgi:hypothetical protein
MRVRPDWRAAVVVMAVVLVVGLIVVVVQGPGAAGLFGVELARSSVQAGDEGDDQDASGDGASADEDDANGETGGKKAGEKKAGEKDGDKDGEKASEKDGEKKAGGKKAGEKKDRGKKAGGKDAEDASGDEEFAGRDQIGEASDDEYVDIQSVKSGEKVGEGGDFSGGSFRIECGLSPHKNSDNPIIAPGVRNGAQHTHDYAGNESTNFASDSDSLAQAGTTCTNGDQHPFFWPVLRDLTGTGPDVGADGGSLDGNVGSFLEPSEVDYTFHGHGSKATEAMPQNLVLSTGAAKAATANGEGANAKYSCSGFEDRVTDQYPLCPQGSKLQRLFDFPSCWNGQDLDSEDHTSHLVFPDEQGECSSGDVPVPAMRITVSYDAPQGRSFAIDSFPDQQHNPITDHALFENLTSKQRAQDGADCINQNKQCLQGATDDVAFSTDPDDQVPPSLTFAHALSSHAPTGRDDRRAGPRLSPAGSAAMLLAAAALMVVASVGTGPRLVARLRDTRRTRGGAGIASRPRRGLVRRRRSAPAAGEEDR